MTELTSKIKIRAEIFSILNKYRNENAEKISTFDSDIKKLSQIEDKSYLAKVLAKEILENEDVYQKFCISFLLRCAPKEEIEIECRKILKEEKYEDDKKIHLISVIKQKGIKFEDDEIEDFIQDIDLASIKSVSDFLSNALKNPEVQIDLMDFFINITEEERNTLFENLNYECSEDIASNAFSILIKMDELTKEEKETAKKSLLNSSSYYAISGLEHIFNNFKLKKEESLKLDKKIKTLKFKHQNIKKHPFIEKTKPFLSFISFLDGNDNFSIIFSRIDKKNRIDAFFVTIDILKGITSCIGFYKMGKVNFYEILKRLFTDSPLTAASPNVISSLLDHYSKKNKITNYTIPYEYTVWSNLLSDVEQIKTPIDKYINSKLTPIKAEDKKLVDFFNSKILSTWFYKVNQSEIFNKFFKNIDEKMLEDYKLYEKYLNNFVESELLQNKNYMADFKSRLLLESYICHVNIFSILSAFLYGLCYNEDHLKEFLKYISSKSLFYYLNEIIEDDKSNNIFKKSKIKTNLSKDLIVKFNKTIKRKWKLKNA